MPDQLSCRGYPMTTERIATILYIEDNRANQLLVEMILERRQGLRLLTADTGNAGLEAAKREHPDLVLLDISLPDIDGYAVLQSLRAHPDTCRLPVVAISGDIPKTTLQGQGFSRYLKKPIEIAPLFQVIDDLLPTS